MEMIENLLQFGLTRQEATIYLALINKGKLTGYEAGKITGISRSNAYSALASLVEKGAAYMIEGLSTSYTPVDIEEFCNNKIRKLNEIKKELVETIPLKEDAVEGYITIKGQKNILDKAKNMIKSAEKRLYISANINVIEYLMDELILAVSKGLKVVIITKEPFYLEHAIIYYNNNPEHQIRLIVDSMNVLTGDILKNDNDTCLYSKKQNLVDLIKDAMKNEIKLIEINGGK